MKQSLRLILALALSACMGIAQMRAQDYEPTTSWPYLYKDFGQGEIFMKGGQKMIQKLNVHLAHSTVHYLDKETVKQLSLKDVALIEIGRDKFLVYDSAVYKVTASNEKGMLLEQSTGNFAALAETGGAYGTSSTSSATRSLSSLETGNTVGCNHMILYQNKDNGQTLPLIVKYYIKTADFFCPARKKELDECFAARADEWKAWLKANKIKWNKSESLERILEFL